MTSKLPNCPFCGGADVHAREFGIRIVERFAQCRTCEISVPLEVWNRRATQPDAGEPVYQWREDESQRWWTTSKADYEWILGNRPSYQARILWTAPPAAAHGDEAVRKPVLAGYFSFCEDKQKWLQQKSKGAEFNHLFTPLYAMRAQGVGEVK